MLILYYITSTRRQEETSIKITISQKHGKPCSKHRKTSNKQNANKTLCPHKQRKTVQGHPLSTHVCNSYQEIDRSQNTSNTCYVQTKNCQINRSPGVTLCTTKRRIRCPPNTRSLLYQSTLQQQDHSHWQYPEANVVHTRKCHIGCSNHNGYEPVAEPPHQSRHYNEEKHLQSVSCNQNVVLLPIPCLNTRSSAALLHSN